MESRYRLTLSLGVTDQTALWAAAAALAMNSPYMTMDDVIETIGPIDAPQIEDCLAMLIQPERFGGCVVETLDVSAADDHRPRAPDDGTPPPMRTSVEARRERFACQTGQRQPARHAAEIEPQARTGFTAVGAGMGSMLYLR